MRGASIADWQWLCKLNDAALKVYLYHHSEHSISIANDVVPWPVLFTLTRFNRKHRWMGKKPPSLESVRKKLTDFENK